MRIMNYIQFNEGMRVLSDYKCPVCRGALYRTDVGGNSVTLQCSSDEAKFWDFMRGTEEQKKSHDHFVRSTTYVSNSDWDKLLNNKKNNGPLLASDNVIEPIPSSKVRT